ncbi:hypothetical protein IW261DRAFT_1564436 [Armillaria novae-zelandiae]|uniref:JmjC domain-containing protein n=1 Tax=Armillaria novae-zelandiae TaxID=153914 RepID=A0AA39P8Y5_9AGAR|nr:hypothetical protein IW261DRAFT_1564436 [Armillaria novae-zelandiae]
MSTEALQFENAYSENLRGYSAAKQSSLVWSLPVLCRQFLTTPLDPEKWFRMRAVTSDQDREILEFGKAMGRTLKFVADESWSKGDPPKDSIDFILPVRGMHKSANHLDTLVLVKAMDIAAGFLRLPTRSYYPSFGKVIKLENSHVGYLKRLDDWPRKLEQIQTSFRMYSERTSIPLLAVVLGRDEGEVILHNNEVDDREMITAWNDCVVLDNPRYRLPEMGKGMDDSMITTMAHSVAMDNPSATLETFRNYNIYHYMRARHPLSWSLPNLSLVGNVDSLREVQDHQRRASKETKDNINVNMSLRELFEEGLEQEGRVLNALALPYLSSFYPYDCSSILSSHCRAFEHTSDMPADIFDTTYPVSATSFWLVATKGAISYMHCDCHGVGTVVEVLCGRKLWYIFRRRGSSADDSMIEEYMGDWAPGFIPSPDEWEAEVVLLEPGSAFPDTHHAVLTLENSIVKGHHIYATTTLAKSVTGWIHTCMLEYRIANVLHPELHELLLRIMCHFYRVMTNDDDKGFHYLEIPEMSRNGLLDIIALGNLCIFSSALLPCIEESPEQVKIAIATATGAYLSLIRYLKARYRLIFLSSPENEAAAKLPRVRSMDIGDFAVSSAAHFGRSLIYYSRMAYKLRMRLHDDSNVLHALKSMKNEVNASLNTFLHIDLTDEFLYTYKNEQKKCLHLRPVFDVRHKEDILDLGIYNACDMFESSQASVKHMEMKDFDGKETDNEGSFDEEEQSQSGDQDEENSEDASGSEYKP